MAFLSWIESVKVFFIIFVYICIAIILKMQLSRGEGWDPINLLTRHIFVHVSSLDSKRQMCNDLKWEVIVHFVDIGWIVETITTYTFVSSFTFIYTISKSDLQSWSLIYR